MTAPGGGGTALRPSLTRRDVLVGACEFACSHIHNCHIGVAVLQEVVHGACNKYGTWQNNHIDLAAVQDAASALLAARVGADMLLLLTDAPAVYDPSKWPKEKVPIKSPVKAAELLGSGDFARGSMGPKVRGCGAQ